VNEAEYAALMNASGSVSMVAPSELDRLVTGILDSGTPAEGIPDLITQWEPIAHACGRELTWEFLQEWDLLRAALRHKSTVQIWPSTLRRCRDLASTARR
jgi:hypothetical protein